MKDSLKTYPEVEANPDFPALEEQVLIRWKKDHAFLASVEHRPAVEDGHGNEFIFYDGPPFANGLPHYGHLLTGYVKDLFARYQTMRGRRVERRFGWDCHGLPAEMGAEKELGISGRQAILHYGMGRFNDYCRNSVMRYTHEWEYYVTRQARWVDFKHDYKTMDKSFMESVLWAFSELYKKGFVYEAHRVMPYSWAAETPLSNFETRLDNSYRERVDKAVTVAFELNAPPANAPQGCRSYRLLAWTTTPWTLPSNLALAVNRDIHYTYTIVGDVCYIHSVNAAAALRKILVPADRVLETPHFYLREFREEDFPLFAALMADEAVNALLKPVGNAKQARQIFNGMLAQYQKDGFSKWAVFEKGTDRFAGRAGVNKVPERADIDLIEVGYILHKEFWGKGYATELASAIYDWCFTSRDMPEMFSLCHPENKASSRVMLKFGLTHKDEVFYPFLGDKRDRYAIGKADYLAHNAIKGSDLIGLTYKPLFPYFSNHPDSFRVLDGSDFVTDADGTGIVHMAPGFGEDDQRVCEAAGIELVCPVDGAGRFTDAIYDLPDLSLKGLNVLEENLKEYKFGEANERITQWLKKHGHLIRQEQITHNYPHCWRTDKPLIFRAMPSWYVEVTKYRERMVELNKQINWIPAHIRDGLFGKWLENARDWSISRNRFWGTPIPVWRSPSGKIKVFGSIAELEAASGQKVTDLHRPAIDRVTVTEDGETFTRVEDVFDCWFESGSMPYAQVHYPFENKNWFESHSPADFIVEYVAQTRGWFYTLMALHAGVFHDHPTLSKTPPFTNCICHGVVLDDQGQKLSKRLNNYADPIELFKKFGADALRWFMMASPVMRGAELHIDKEGKFIRDVVRLAIKPIWNAYNFFCLYANADGVTAKLVEGTGAGNLMDRYILAKCAESVEGIAKALDHYDTPSAAETVTRFFDALNNWYIRRSKERFWKETHDAEKQSAYDTLFTVLHVMCRAAAPLLPLTLDSVFTGLTGEKSVHLADFPDRAAFRKESELVRDMDRVQDICNAALSVRAKNNLRVRLPLASVKIVTQDFDVVGAWRARYGIEMANIIKGEINVKEVSEGDTHFQDFAAAKIQIHFPVLGKRLPEKIKQIIPAVKKGVWKKCPDGRIDVAGETLELTEFTFIVEPKPAYTMRAQALAGNDALVVLDTEVTPELQAEGYSRDLIRLIQQARKDAGLKVTDRIDLRLRVSSGLADMLRTHRDKIAEQVLASSLTEGDMLGCGVIVNDTIENEEISIGFSARAAA